MPLPEWIRERRPDLEPTPDDNEEFAGYGRCNCGGEGCDACDNTGVRYA